MFPFLRGFPARPRTWRRDFFSPSGHLCLLGWGGRRHLSKGLKIISYLWVRDLEVGRGRAFALLRDGTGNRKSCDLQTGSIVRALLLALFSLFSFTLSPSSPIPPDLDHHHPLFHFPYFSNLPDSTRDRCAECAEKEATAGSAFSGTQRFQEVAWPWVPGAWSSPSADPGQPCLAAQRLERPQEPLPNNFLRPVSLVHAPLPFTLVLGCPGLAVATLSRLNTSDQPSQHYLGLLTLSVLIIS